MMKDLLLAYLKDMQEDKTYVFDGALSLELSAGSNDGDHW
uniref:Argininosuccinate lyase n=1 Tax=Bartonella schoenbuchensis TaxID=165694 RepID=A0A024LPC8_9HYPH|nr:argininosuccinate lyase [Bartonella schoenbuchensis]